MKVKMIFILVTTLVSVILTPADGAPVSVPVSFPGSSGSAYSRPVIQHRISRQPNSNFNRLTNNRLPPQVQVDEIIDDGNDPIEDYDENVTDDNGGYVPIQSPSNKPVNEYNTNTPSNNNHYNRPQNSQSSHTSQSTQITQSNNQGTHISQSSHTSSSPSSSSSNYISPLSDLFNDKPIYFDLNSKFGGFHNLFGEDRHRHRFKRRRHGQPCIPVQGNKHYRNAGRGAYDYNDYDDNSGVNGKTLYGLNYYSINVNPGGGGYGQQSNLYDSVGGYPCIPISFGQSGGGLFNRPSGGPFGFFGNGGLFDINIGPSTSSSSSQDNVQSDTGTSGNRPQRPNRPQISFDINQALDSIGMWKPGEIFSGIASAFQTFGQQVSAPVRLAGQINREFLSLL